MIKKIGELFCGLGIPPFLAQSSETGSTGTYTFPESLYMREPFEAFKMFACVAFRRARAFCVQTPRECARLLDVQCFSKCCAAVSAFSSAF